MQTHSCHPRLRRQIVSTKLHSERAFALVSPSLHPGFPSRRGSCLLPGLVFPLTAVFYPAAARPAVMNVRGDGEEFFSFCWGKVEDAEECRVWSGGADGLPVCLLCLKSTAGEAPSQTSPTTRPAVISDPSAPASQSCRIKI